MKKTSILIIFALLAFGPMVWAQDWIEVSDANGLNNAITNGTYIRLTADITLSAHLTIPAEKTITINLGGHTLRRNLSSATEMGCVIIVAASGNLTLTGGTLSGGWNSGYNNDGIHSAGGIVNKGSTTLNNVTITNCKGIDGGAIMNAINATLNITGGTISNCESNQGGGGIVNKGYSATIIGCTFDNNTAKTRGGAIWSNSSISTGGCTFSNNKALAEGEGGDGGAIHVESSTFTLVDDIITGNSSKDAGAIYVKSGARLDIYGNTLISGNESTEHGGGGIVNYGTVNMLGGTITNNTCHTDGAGIWNNGTITMQGDVQVKNNIGDDVFLKNGTSIHTGSLTSGQNSIGIRMETPNVFTAGYGTNNQGNFNHFFSSGTINPIELIDGECKMFLAYYECTWDSESKKVVQTVKTVPDNVTLLNVCTSTFASGGNLTGSQWFIADGTGSTANGLTCGDGDRHLILCDGASITINKGFFVNEGSTLHIYCQSFENKMGKLISNNTEEDWPGIGGKYDQMGTLIIHGGDITASGGKYGAGIGGRRNRPGKNITIYGGKIKATGGEEGAGIGGGTGCKGENITIYGGTITANGGKFGAGIGGGDTGSDDGGCNLTIHGGTINATGGISGAGIGSGEGDCNQVTITINGGTINAKGGPYSSSSSTNTVFLGGAGIGGGERGNITSITINGGNITATAQNDGAGIGSGPEADQVGTITINGGEIHAFGGVAQHSHTLQYGGAGIGGGGGEVQGYGVGGPVVITGGTIYAQGGMGAAGNGAAIGHGGGSSINGTLGLPENYSVKAGNSPGTATLMNAEDRESGCQQFYALVEPCIHNEASFTDNGNGVTFSSCSHCATGNGTEPYTFKTVGYWNVNDNWLGSIMPGEGKDVKVTAAAIIPNNYLAHVGNITIQEGGSLTISNGGQLIHSNAGVTATVEKNIAGHEPTDLNGWYFIASPMVTDITPSEGNGFLTNEYDLYYYHEPTSKWRNYKSGISNQDPGFQIEPQQGYLYANEGGTTLNMTGTLRPSNESVTINNLSYTSTAAPLSGWNLVGNPFACNAVIDKSCYTIVGNAINSEANEANSYVIPPCTGVMVKATESDQTVTFTKTTDQASQGRNLQIMLSQAVSTRSTALLDKAIVSFTEGNELEKFVFNEDNAKLYIPQDGKDYAIVCVSAGTDIASNVSTNEVSVNFEANENGTYTISVNPEGVEMDYLHLIDNMTGADVDLLDSPTYTFTAKTTDYVSRFRLVFNVNDASTSSASDAPFAFINNGQIIVTAADACNACLQVVDVMGRIVVSTDVARNVSTSEMTPGVYVLRLINGNNVRTQKIVIK